jgi:hypothetical protein
VVNALESRTAASAGFDLALAVTWGPFTVVAFLVTLALTPPWIAESRAVQERTIEIFIACAVCAVFAVFDCFLSLRHISREKAIGTGLWVLDLCERVASSRDGQVAASVSIAQLRRAARSHRVQVLYYASPLGAFAFGGYSSPAWTAARRANKLLKNAADGLLRAAGTDGVDRVARIVGHGLVEIASDRPENLVPVGLPVAVATAAGAGTRPSPRMIAACGALTVLAGAAAIALSGFGAGAAIPIVLALAVSTYNLWAKRSGGGGTDDDR